MTAADAVPATWEAVLDDLEREVERAERLSAESQGPGAWTPPAGLGPLPRHLLDRAQRLLERQQAAAARLPEELGATMAQLRVGRRIERATTRATMPVYLDVTA